MGPDIAAKRGERNDRVCPTKALLRYRPAFRFAHSKSQAGALHHYLWSADCIWSFIHSRCGERMRSAKDDGGRAIGDENRRLDMEILAVGKGRGRLTLRRLLGRALRRFRTLDVCDLSAMRRRQCPRL